MKTPVLITGIGMSTPLGLSLSENIAGIQAGLTGLRRISAYEHEGSAIQYAGEIEKIDQLVLPNRKLKKMVNRKDYMGVATARACIQDSGIVAGSFDCDRAGAFVGACSTQLGDFLPYFKEVLNCVSDDRQNFYSEQLGAACVGSVNPLAAVKVLMNGALAHISQAFQLKGPNTNIVNMETSGLDAVIEATRAIQRGDADWCVAGSIYAPLDPFQMTEAYHAGDLSDQTGCSQESPKVTVKPFADRHTGTFLSEGSVFFVLESEQSATARGAANVYGQLEACENAGCGAAATNQKYHSQQLAKAVGHLMETPDKPAFIMSQASGIKRDNVEKAALATFDLPVHSFASQLGHLGESCPTFNLAMATQVLSRNDLALIDLMTGNNYDSSTYSCETKNSCIVDALNQFGASCAVRLKKVER